MSFPDLELPIRFFFFFFDVEQKKDHSNRPKKNYAPCQIFFFHTGHEKIFLYRKFLFDVGKNFLKKATGLFKR